MKGDKIVPSVCSKLPENYCDWDFGMYNYETTQSLWQTMLNKFKYENPDDLDVLLINGNLPSTSASTIKEIVETHKKVRDDLNMKPHVL